MYFMLLLKRVIVDLFIGLRYRQSFKPIYIIPLKIYILLHQILSMAFRTDFSETLNWLGVKPVMLLNCVDR